MTDIELQQKIAKCAAISPEDCRPCLGGIANRVARHLHIYCCPVVSGVIPNDFWQYLVFVTPFFTGLGDGVGIGGGWGANKGGCPVASRCDWRPNKMPSVTAMGMASSAALMRMRIVMAGKNEGRNERLDRRAAGG